MPIDKPIRVIYKDEPEELDNLIYCKKCDTLYLLGDTHFCPLVKDEIPKDCGG